MKVRLIPFGNFTVPRRQHRQDTGADVYMMCGGSIEPHETLVIPLGFGIDIPNGYSARLQVRTSIAAKGIMAQGCAIDAGYKGGIHLILHNVSNNIFKWKKGDRLAYIEVYPCVYPDFTLDDEEERDRGAFGSTGR